MVKEAVKASLKMMQLTENLNKAAALIETWQVNPRGFGEVEMSGDVLY